MSVIASDRSVRNIDIQKIHKHVFGDVKDFYEYLIDNQIITEFRELSEDEVTPEIRVSIMEGKKMKKSEFINI